MQWSHLKLLKLIHPELIILRLLLSVVVSEVADHLEAVEHPEIVDQLKVVGYLKVGMVDIAHLMGMVDIL